MSNKLTDKQKLFCEAYITNGFNATEAAKEVGYSEDTARQQGSRLFTNVDIKSNIKNRINELLDNREELQKQWVDNVIEMAFYELSGDSDEDKYRASDKTKALELLGKYLTLFTEKKEVKHLTLDEDGNEIGMDINISFTG